VRRISQGFPEAIALFAIFHWHRIRGVPDDSRLTDSSLDNALAPSLAAMINAYAAGIKSSKLSSPVF